MNDNTFLLVLAGIVGGTLLGLVASSQLYGVAINRQLVEAIKSGANPFDVACALDHSTSRTAECAIRAAK